MKLYLVQHGKAASEDVDPERALTREGSQEVELVAACLAGKVSGISEVLHSGKTRARQTAELLGPKLAPDAPIREVEGIAPKSDAAPWTKSLKNRKEGLMLVSHLPFLSHLASLLLAGNEEMEIVAFRNAAVVCLERDEAGQWQVAWIFSPELCKPSCD